MTTSERLATALEFAGAGIPVLPLVPRGKIPAAGLAPNGVKNATTDKSIIEQWFTAAPDMNYGLAAGCQIDGGYLIVLDEDEPGALVGLADKHGFNLPATMTVATAKGKHLYYTSLVALKNAVRLGGSGVDLRCVGGYVVGPGSVHESGAEYRLLHGAPEFITPAPDGLVALAAKLDAAGAKELLAAESLPTFQKGGRNAGITQYAGRLYRRGLRPVEVSTLVHGANAGSPEPLARSEVDVILRSAARWDQSPEDVKPAFYTVNDFLGVELPVRETLLDPWLHAQTLSMVAAERGLGKSLFALSVLCAIASGKKFLEWEPKRAAKCLFVDGELSGSLLKMMLKRVTSAVGDPGTNLVVAPYALQVHGYPTLTEQEGQDYINRLIAESGAEIIVLDSISTLVRGGEENAAEDWQPVQDWLLELRRMGKTVLLVHHAGKGGQQRGTSKREDVLDISISLKSDNEEDEDKKGAKFIVDFTKARLEQTPKKLLVQLENHDDGTAQWRWNYADATKEMRVADEITEAFTGNGKWLTVREVVRRTSCSHGTAQRALAGAKARAGVP